MAGVLAAWAAGSGPTGAQTTPTITSTPPPAGVVGNGYVHQFVSSPQTPEPTFSVTSGSLPPGLSLAPNGLVSGAPTAAGSFGPTTVCAGNGAVPPACQTFTLVVAQRSPSILASASPGGPIGTSVTGTANLVGGYVPTGSIRFRLFSDPGCATQVFESTNVVATDGSATSDPFTPTAPGTYRWVASYSGDVNNNAVTSACSPSNEVVITGTTTSTTTVPTTTSTVAPTTTTSTVPPSTSSTTVPTSTSTSTSASTSTSTSTSTTLPPTGTTSSTTTTSTTSSVPTTSTTSSVPTTSTTSSVPTTTSTTAAPTTTTTTVAGSTTSTSPATSTTGGPSTTTTTGGPSTTTTTVAATSTTTSTSTSTSTTAPPAGPGAAEPTAQLSSQQVAPGESLTVSGRGFPAGSALAAQLFSEPVLLGTTSADAAGSFTMTVTVPLDTAPGAHTLRVGVVGGGPYVDLSLFVTSPQTRVVAATTGSLSRTGGELARTTRAALALVVLGSALVGVGWRDARAAVPGFGRRSRWPARRRRWR